MKITKFRNPYVSLSECHFAYLILWESDFGWAFIDILHPHRKVPPQGETTTVRYLDCDVDHWVGLKVYLHLFKE